MFIELAAAASGAFLLGKFIYHKLTTEDEQGPMPALPRIDEGIPVPMLFGRYRIRDPILVWAGPHDYVDDRLRMDLFFVLGLGFQYGLVDNRIHRAWASEIELVPASAINALTGNGVFEDPADIQLDRNGTLTSGFVEFLCGSPAQALTSGIAASTYVSEVMIEAGVDPESIPGYRNVLTVALLQVGGATVGFDHGEGSGTGGMLAYQFEASSYYQAVGAQPLGLFGAVGQDANPIAVIYEVLTATIGKLALPTSLIDLPNFEQAAYTLYIESHGYSRYWSQRATAAEIIYDVLRQIDGVLFTDQTTGLIKIKLIRGDFDPTNIPHITRDNGAKLMSFALGGRTNLINKVTIKFPNRDRSYNIDTATSQNMANAVGQSGQVAEAVLEYMGCCEPALALYLAGRELAARSKPVFKCRVVVDRSFLRVSLGDAVKLTWTNPDIAGAIMRVIGVERGTLEDGAITLDLVSDTFYVHRNQTPLPPDFGGLGLDGLDVGL